LAQAEESKWVYEEAKRKAKAKIDSAKRAEEAAAAVAAADRTMEVNESAQGATTQDMELDEAVHKDKPSEGINSFLAEMMNPDGVQDGKHNGWQEHIDLAASDDEEGGPGKDPKSPPKKKSKAERKQEKKAAKKAAKAAAKEAEKGEKEATDRKTANPTSEPPVSILKTGRVAAGVRVTAARKRRHVHNFHRQIVETSIVLDAPGGDIGQVSIHWQTNGNANQYSVTELVSNWSWESWIIQN
jgi:hypothetical protein